MNIIESKCIVEEMEAGNDKLNMKLHFDFVLLKNIDL